MRVGCTQMTDFFFKKKVNIDLIAWKKSISLPGCRQPVCVSTCTHDQICVFHIDVSVTTACWSTKSWLVNIGQNTPEPFPARRHCYCSALLAWLSAGKLYLADGSGRLIRLQLDTLLPRELINVPHV